MSTLWIFALGLLVGFPIGVMFDDAYDLYRASRKEPRVKFTTGPRTFLTWAMAVVLLLNLGVGVLLIQTRITSERTAEQLAEYSACTSRWQQDFATAYRARFDASLPVSDALDEIVRAVAANDSAQVDAAIQAFLDVRDEQAVKRNANPLPELPEQLCGDAPKADR